MALADPKRRERVMHATFPGGHSQCRNDLRGTDIYPSPPTQPNTDRFSGPVETNTSTAATMQTVKNAIAENLGKVVSGAHSLAPADQQFSLEEVPDLSGKVAVVTGGSEGIGYGCTHTLLSKNISKLFIISWSEDVISDALSAIASELGQEKADRVTWLKCDLADWEQTGKTAFEISQKTDRVDILINNAARGIMTYQLAKNGVDLHMAGNHMGHVVLTSHLLPLLKSTAEKGDKVRIVQLGSNAHESAPKDVKFESVEELNQDLGPMAQYGRTKLCSILYAKYLARHLSSTHPNILSNATHPGFVETKQSVDLIHEAYPLVGRAVDGFDVEDCQGEDEEYECG
ncbi:retinol dehydrogenase 12 [Stemphylium lycopersici]|uniref:Retinol dehydrogenase 12 n=1 Tax=Stemphylium lycopersici TaxID=183478 RepID=A0A364MSF3_STELY|nr:retinol dehydrogenase 12 [Stemphylium lycopersici]RAR01568.1 retinol dehydrogenase 12 [Stemphylium lycopersici]RAR02331.1 retinol dehydrogenase 12 [Stemphylium lycopersici]